MEWVAESLNKARMSAYRVGKDAKIDTSYLKKVAEGKDNKRLGRDHIIAFGEIVAPVMFPDSRADQINWINQGLAIRGFGLLDSSPSASTISPELLKAEEIAYRLIAQMDRIRSDAPSEAMLELGLSPDPEPVPTADAAGGDPLFSEEQSAQAQRSPRWLRVLGDSMAPQIPPGSNIRVKWTPEADLKKVVIAKIEGDGIVCKQLMRDQDGYYLHSFNEWANDIRGPFVILGVVIGVEVPPETLIDPSRNS